MHKDNEKKQFEVKSILKKFGILKSAQINTLISELENYCFSNRGGWNKDNTVLNYALYFERATKHLELSQSIDVLKHLYNISLNSNWNGSKAQKALFEYIEYAEKDLLPMKEYNEYLYNEMLIDTFNAEFVLESIDTVFPLLEQHKFYKLAKELNGLIWEYRNQSDKTINYTEWLDFVLYENIFSLNEGLYLLKSVYNSIQNKGLYSMQCLKAYILNLEKTSTPTQETPSKVVISESEDNHTPTQEVPTSTQETPAIQKLTTYEKALYEFYLNSPKGKSAIAYFSKKYGNKQVYKTFCTIPKKSANHKTPTKQELENILVFFAEYPEKQKEIRIEINKRIE